MNILPCNHVYILALLLYSLCLDYCVLASTFDVLTWRVMPDAGEVAPEELIVPYFAN